MFAAGFGVRGALSGVKWRTRRGDARVRDEDLHGGAGQVRGPAEALPRSHAEDLREARHDQHRLLDSRPTRRTPRTRSSTSSRTRIARPRRRAGRIFGADPAWQAVVKESQKDGPPDDQGRVGLPEPDRLFTDQVARAGKRRDWGWGGWRGAPEATSASILPFASEPPAPHSEHPASWLASDTSC